MIGNRLCAFALVGRFRNSSVSPRPQRQPSIDGSWNMVLVTTNGHCGVINIGMAVNGGHISATSGKFVMHKIALAGLISGSGATKINGVAGPRQAIGTGRFTQVEGRRQVERHRAFGRLLGRLDRRSRLTPFTSSDRR